MPLSNQHSHVDQFEVVSLYDVGKKASTFQVALFVDGLLKSVPT